MKSFLSFLKSGLPIFAYYAAIVLLVIFSGIIVWRFMFLPPCTPTDKYSCGVDAGAVAGFAATIMGVAAAILAVLGAFAVAAWWTNLDQRINEQVNKETNKQVVDIFDKQLTPKYNQMVNALLQAQSKKMNNVFRALTYLDLGNEFLEQKNIKAAMQVFQIAKKLEPNNVQINYMLGRTYRKIKSYDEAIVCLQTAIATDKEFALAHFELGMAYRSQADELYADPALKQQHDEGYEKAIKCLKEAIRLLPEDEENIATLGGTYRRYGKNQDALDCYNQALKLNPDSAYALGNVALLSWHEGKLADSRSAYTRTEQIANKRIATKRSYEPFWDYYDLAMAKLVLGQKEEALKDYQSAVDLTPTPENFQSVLSGLDFLKEVEDKYPIVGLHDAITIVESGKAEVESRLAKQTILD
jgi:tetratricopeptide (TPR) repeat protein